MDDKLVKNYISYVSGMSDMVKSYKDILITLSNYMRHGIKFICRESQCKKRGIKDYSKLEE